MHGQNLILQLLRLPTVVEGVGDASKLRLQLCDFGAENNDVSLGRDLSFLLETVATPHTGCRLGLVSRDAKRLRKYVTSCQQVKLRLLDFR